MSLKLDTTHVIRDVNTKAGNQKNFNDLKGDVRAIFGAVRPGINNKWPDGPLFQALKQISAKLDALYVAVRVGIAGKQTDGPLAKFIRDCRNFIRDLINSRADAQDKKIAELNAKLERIINKIGA